MKHRVRAGVCCLAILGVLQAAAVLVARRQVRQEAASASLGSTVLPLSGMPGDRKGQELDYGPGVGAGASTPASDTEDGHVAYVSGTVRHHDGTPAEGCTLTITRKDNSRKVQDARTDPDGRFRIEGVGQGWSYLEVSCAELTQGQQFELSPNQTSKEVDFVLPDAWDVLVRVVDEQGRPIPGIRIQLDSLVRRDVGPDGTVLVRVERSPQNFSSWTAIDDDHGWYGNSVFASPPDAEVVIPMRRAGVISGVLLDPDGHPVPASELCLDLEGELISQWLTDASGRFRVLADFGQPYTLRTANAPDEPRILDAHGRHRSMKGELHGVQAGDFALELRTTWMSWERELGIRVLSPEGEVLLNPCVVVSPEIRACVRFGLEERRGDRGLIWYSKLPESRFCLLAYPLQEDAESADWLEARVEHVIPTGQTVELQFRHGAWIEGHVYLPDGNPAADVSVWVEGPHSGRAGRSTTDATGSFRMLIDPLRPSPFSVSAAAKFNGCWQRGTAETVEPGRKGLRIQLQQDDP